MFKNKQKIFYQFLILILIIIGIFTYYKVKASYNSNSVGYPPFEDDPSVMIKRKVSPAVPVACPAGWSDGGIGDASYGASITIERYCY